MVAPSVPGQGCLRWVPRLDVGSPGPRYAHSLAYDPQRGVTVFFGGEYSLLGGDPEYFNDVWEYDGVRWRKVAIVGESPSPRCWASMAFGTTLRPGNGTVLTGMRLGQGIGYDGVETREWIYTANADGSGAWTPLSELAVEHDAWLPRGARDLGGATDVDDDGDLTTLSQGGLRLADHVVVDHGIWQEELVLGGGRMDDVGDHDNPNQIPGPGIVQLHFGVAEPGGQRAWIPLRNPTGVAPGNRFQHAATFDPNRGRVVVFGGHAIPGADRHWELARPETEDPTGGASWVRMDWLNPMPPERALAGMVYDARRQVTVLVGGVGGTRYGDTWELVQLPAEIAPIPAEQLVGCEARPILIQPSVRGSDPLRRQWYYLDDAAGGGWKALVGETGPGLTVSRLHAGDYHFRLEVTDACDNVSRRDFQIVIHDAPRVFLPFERIDACPGDSRTLESIVTSTLPFTVQWHRDGKPVGDRRELPPGRHPYPLFLANLTPADTARYDVVAVSACGSSSPSVSSVEVPDPGQPAPPNLRVGPRIVREPASETSAVCTATTLTVLAEGVGTLRYEWRLDGQAFEADGRRIGVSSNRLTLHPLLQSDGGDYDVVVWDDCGRGHAVTSRVATLTVTPGPTWHFRTTQGPPPRFRHALAYDAARRVTVLFGGAHEDGTTSRTYNDLWEWDGTRWTPRQAHAALASWTRDPVSGRWDPSYRDQPAARTEHAMAYDPRRGRVVLFGGATLDPGGFERRLNDLWEWDGARWEFRGTNGPAWRVAASLVDQGARARLLLAGGVQAPSDPAPNALWEWDGTAWRIDGDRSGPGGGNTASLAHDRFRDVLVYGPTAGLSGVVHDNFWTLGEAGWNVRPGAFHVGEPTAAYGSLAYDPHRRRTVYSFGTKGGTGSWDGRRWVVHADPAPPRARFAHATAYDSHRRALVMFGGTFGFQGHFVSTNDTWELVAPDKPLFLEQPASQFRKLGETLVLRAATSVPPGAVTRYRWLHDGVPLADGNRISGSTSDTLRIVEAGQADAGRYQAVASCDCGETRSLPAIVTFDARLQIFAGAETTTLLWSDPAAVLQWALDANGPWQAVPGAASPFHPAALGPAGFFRLHVEP